MLPFLNVFFFVFHTVWVLFVCLGWAWRRARFGHLVAVALTALSWFVLGYRYGWGYCLCTDWHWQVRDKLGYPWDHSYTHLLILGVTGIDTSPLLADALTGGLFAVAAVLSIVLNVRDLLRKTRRD